MIPKVIHYCWFGKGPKSKLIQKCIQSWKEYLPDYQIVEWNESNFDICSNTFARQAYTAKKYAFVSDYVRLFALYNYGGIYMDTDVQVVKRLDEFLDRSAFSGFEDNNELIPTGTLGSIKNHPWIGRMLDYYTDQEFIKSDETMDTTANVEIITDISIKEYGLELGNHNMQVLKDDVYIYPSDYFCPKDYRTGKIRLTGNTYTIHHFAGSWLPAKEIYRKKTVWLIRRILKLY